LPVFHTRYPTIKLGGELGIRTLDGLFRSMSA